MTARDSETRALERETRARVSLRDFSVGRSPSGPTEPEMLPWPWCLWLKQGKEPGFVVLESLVNLK